MQVLEREFIEGRVKKLRELAERADPFIRKRLLRLAEDYERRLPVPRRREPQGSRRNIEG